MYYTEPRAKTQPYFTKSGGGFLAVSSVPGAALERLGAIVWGPPMLGVFLAAGAWLTLRTKGFQLRRLPFWMRNTFGTLLRKQENAGVNSITQRQAMAAALAACLGTGNIVGVASALRLGGPGALFWMWLSAALGMMTCCAENVLGAKYRWRLPGGGWMGGPMAYLSKGLGSKALAGAYAALLALAACGMGNMTQANAIAEAARQSLRLPPLAVGLILAALLALVIFGGVGRIARVTERLVPVMTGAFLLACLAILFLRRSALPGVFVSIFKEAFLSPAAAAGGTFYGFRKAMRYGIARGVFSNEAGLGSSAVIHAAAEGEPAQQGLWGIAEVFVDTILMCGVTGLALLCSGAWQAGRAGQGGGAGVAAVGGAFAAVFGPWGERFVSLSVALFAFATLTGWSYYGEQGSRYLLGEKSVKPYRFVYLGAAVLGSALRLETVWNAADILNGLMALPNLLGVAALSGQAARELGRYERRAGAKISRGWVDFGKNETSPLTIHYGRCNNEIVWGGSHRRR